ncbi:MAG: hypothetical protein WAZ77_05075, partial [Candidatus Nitrosopolaris sp.]
FKYWSICGIVAANPWLCIKVIPVSQSIAICPVSCPSVAKFIHDVTRKRLASSIVVCVTGTCFTTVFLKMTMHVAFAIGHSFVGFGDGMHELPGGNPPIGALHPGFIFGVDGRQFSPVGHVVGPSPQPTTNADLYPTLQ